MGLDMEVINKITAFLDFVGVPYTICVIDGPTLLPGLQLLNGTIVIDTGKLLYPGDILHEAGHLATASPAVRETMSDPLPDIDIHRSGELMALSWSYAACLHIGLLPEIVFHPEGYQGDSDGILSNFAAGNYIALPMLQYCGMAYNKNMATELKTLPYPNMVNWLRQT